MTVKALAAEHVQFNLSHIEPATMFGSETELQAFKNSTSHSRFECFMQGRWLMGAKVVQRYLNKLGVRKVDINQVSYAMSEVDHGASVGDLDMSPCA